MYVYMSPGVCHTPLQIMVGLWKAVHWPTLTRLYFAIGSGAWIALYRVTWP